MTDYLIYSNHHQMWWGPNGCGYRSHIADAGRYALADTMQWLGRGCGCCKVPEVVVEAPSVEVMAVPGGLYAYSIGAVESATQLAELEGRVNRYAGTVTR